MLYAPEAKKVAVKDYVSRYAARCRPPARTFNDIREAASVATKLAVRHAPATDAGPYTVEVEVDATQLADFAAMVPTVERIGERRISYTTTSAREMLRCFKAVTTLISSGIERTYG
jgi:D-amino peptidase